MLLTLQPSNAVFASRTLRRDLATCKRSPHPTLLFSTTSALFCILEIHNYFPFNRFHTLCPKHPGVGYVFAIFQFQFSSFQSSGACGASHFPFSLFHFRVPLSPLECALPKKGGGRVPIPIFSNLRTAPAFTPSRLSLFSCTYERTNLQALCFVIFATVPGVGRCLTPYNLKFYFLTPAVSIPPRKKGEEAACRGTSAVRRSPWAGGREDRTSSFRERRPPEERDGRRRHRRR